MVSDSRLFGYKEKFVFTLIVKMVEKAGEDYAKIIQSINLEREINPICMNIEDMLARLDEFETQLSRVKAETNGIMAHHVNGIVEFSDNFELLRNRIDKLEQFVDRVNANVDEVERSLDNAEQELNVTDYSLRGLLLKPLLAKAKATGAGDAVEQASNRSNLKDGVFQPVPIFSTAEHFGNCQLSSSEEAMEVGYLGE